MMGYFSEKLVSIPTWNIISLMILIILPKSSSLPPALVEILEGILQQDVADVLPI